MMIERAGVEDAEAILTMQKESYVSQAEIYNDYSLLPLVETLEETKKDIEKRIILKALVEGRIVGAVRVLVEGDTCYIGKLCVHPDFQKQGIGRKLIYEVEKTFTSAKRFELFAGTKSLDNIRLYEKLGYKKFKIEKYNENTEVVFLQK